MTAPLTPAEADALAAAGFRLLLTSDETECKTDRRRDLWRGMNKIAPEVLLEKYRRSLAGDKLDCLNGD